MIFLLYIIYMIFCKTTKQKYDTRGFKANAC